MVARAKIWASLILVGAVIGHGQIEAAKKKRFSQVGIATFYGAKFQGRRTASGEIYDQDKLTAAHRTLPFDTYVLVTRLDNGKKVAVRINDRGPFTKGRIIDLSYAAAKKIDMIRAGLVKVRIEVVDK